jgi:hypothetical protein
MEAKTIENADENAVATPARPPRYNINRHDQGNWRLLDVQDHKHLMSDRLLAWGAATLYASLDKRVGEFGILVEETQTVDGKDRVVRSKIQMDEAGAQALYAMLKDHFDAKG